MAECTCLRCGHNWNSRKDPSQIRKCPGCQNPGWQKKSSRNLVECVEVVVPDLPSNVALDPDGAMMQTVPDNRIAKAKERAMELLGRIK